MKKHILPFILCLTLLVSALSLGVFAAEPESYSAEIMQAYNGANGIVSMTFDDGDWNTNVWLDQMFEKYDLYGSTMAIVRSNYEKKNGDVYEMDPTKVERWRNLFANGRLEVESHTYTHMVLPSERWMGTDPERIAQGEENNNPENYQQEIVESKNLIKDYLGYDAICLAPSNNTLSDGAMEYVKRTYYAVRQGDRFQVGRNIQSLDPTPGSEQTGGWYNLWMLAFYDNEHEGVNVTIPNAVEYAAQNGGWVVTMCHGIQETSGDATYAEAEALFQKLSEYQKAGTVWVTTFGRATKYIRERQNSTVTYNYALDGAKLEVKMADMTADGLPLPESIFNHPLTVKIQLSNGVEKVVYKMDGVERSANAFVENGKTYAYVNVIPNSGEITVKPVAEGGIFTMDDLAMALKTNGTYKLAGNLSVDGSAVLNATAENVVIDLSGNTLTFIGKNTIKVVAGANVTFTNGKVVVAHAYENGTKVFNTYKPIIENEDGTFTLGASTSIADAGIIAEEDKAEMTSSPAFTVNGGTLTLLSVSLERGVAVSKGSELLSVLSGEVILRRSEVYDSVGVLSWANVSTRLIYMQRQATPTKLTIDESHIYMALPNSYYNGTLLSNEAPKSIDSATGALTSANNILDGKDTVMICYVNGTTADTGVDIDITNSHIETYHRGFLSATNYKATDTLNMSDSRMVTTSKSNYQSRGFEFYSADLVFENCLLHLVDNGITMNDGDKGDTSLVMKQCYVYCNHILRSPSVKNDIYLEDVFMSGGMLRWNGYDNASSTSLPTIKIAGSFYTTTPICEKAPVYETEDWPSNSTKNFWFNLVKTNETDTIVSGTPTWAVVVKHADGTRDILTTDNATKNVLVNGDILYLWNRSVTNTIVEMIGDVDVRTYGVESHFIVYGNGSFNPLDGTLGQISLIRGDGSHIYYLNNAEKTLQNTFGTLASGQTLVLESDQRVDSALFVPNNKQIAVDLNGYTVYHAAVPDNYTRIEPLFGTQNANSVFYLYSSRAGGRVMNGYNYRVYNGKEEYNNNLAGTVFRCNSGKLFLGYGLNGAPRGERFSVYGGQLVLLDKGEVRINGSDWYNISNDNSTAFMFMGENAGRVFRFTNSNLYMRFHARVCSFRNMTKTPVDIVFENANIYSNNAGRLLIYEFTADTMLETQTIILRNSGVYNMKFGAKDKFRVILEGNCYTYEKVSEFVTVAPGHFTQDRTADVTVTGTSYPQGSLYGGEEMLDANASYRYNQMTFSAKDYLGTLYTNITLDSALDLHLYVPVDANLTSVKADGVELLDKEALETIGTKEYYDVTISKAPKYASDKISVTITIANRTYYLEHSLVNYAKNLLSMDESKVSEASRAYLADSKEMMRYALQYAKEVITAYGDPAELDEINALLGTFALTDADKVLENVKENLPSGTGVSAAFDLDAKVGFALGVANTFTGKVTVNIGEDTVSGEYTGDATANGDIVDVLVIPNILAYRLYAMDVTITVEGENAGVAVNTTFTYNLATYVNSGVSGNVGTALYAYAKAAKAYGEKHTVGTID
ncbi:MAG: polysaccharide deacetylase family protein [Clostridia bacterium]|nr:polysaccharide deacetylase family protein [Clostridia bacterium]